MIMNVKDFTANLSQNIRRKYSPGNVVLFSLILLLFILIIPAYMFDKKAEQELSAMENRLNEFSLLSKEYNKLKTHVSAVENKRFLSKTDSIINALNEVFSPLGVKSRIKSIKDLSEREIEGGTKEKSAEVIIEQVSLNESVNIFYKIENAPMLLKINNVSIKKSFAFPEFLDISMNISLFTATVKTPGE